MRHTSTFVICPSGDGRSSQAFLLQICQHWVRANCVADIDNSTVTMSFWWEEGQRSGWHRSARAKH